MRRLADETLVYDLESYRAACLNRAAAAVWERCDGEMAVEAIAREVTADLGRPFGPEAVWYALDQLERRRLVEPLEAQSRPSRTRREWLRELGAAGLSGALLPTVLAVMAPTAAEAATVITGADCVMLSPPCPGTSCVVEGMFIMYMGTCNTVTVGMASFCLCQP